MNDIIQISRFIREHNLDDSFLTSPNSRETLIKRLYAGINKGLISNENDASIFLFKSLNKNGLWRVKQQLRERLFEIVLTLKTDNQTFSSLKKNYFIALKHFTVAEYLSKNGFLMTAIPILEKTINLAIKIDYTELIFLTSRPLYQYYAIEMQSKQKFKKYQKLYVKSIEIMRYEMMARDYYIQLSHLTLNNLSNSKIFRNKLIEYSDKLNSINIEKNTYIFRFNKYEIDSTKYFVFRRYDLVLKNAQEAILFFQQKPFSTFLITFSFTTDLIFSNILLKKHEEAEKQINSLLPEFKFKSYNYYKTQFYHFFNYSYWGKYDKLFYIVNDGLIGLNNKKTHFQYENWKIREAYVYFLIEAGKINLSQKERENYSSFKLAKFINDVPIF